MSWQSGTGLSLSLSLSRCCPALSTRARPQLATDVMNEVTSSNTPLSSPDIICARVLAWSWARARNLCISVRARALTFSFDSRGRAGREINRLWVRMAMRKRYLSLWKSVFLGLAGRYLLGLVLACARRASFAYSPSVVLLWRSVRFSLLVAGAVRWKSDFILAGYSVMDARAIFMGFCSLCCVYASDRQTISGLDIFFKS